jgi:hypothetical protein
MKARTSRLALVALLVAPAAALAQDATPHLPPDSMELGRKYIEWWFGAEVDSLRSVMTEEMQERWSEELTLERMDMVAEQIGFPTKVVEEKYMMRNGMPQYWYTAEFDTAPEAFMVRWVITPEGKIDGIGLNPASMAPETDPPADEQ